MRVLRTLRRTATALAIALPLAYSGSAASATQGASRPEAPWSADERSMLQSLSLASLPALPADPSNAYTDRPEAARLGAQLFFDTLMSGNGRVSCATCHQPGKDFQDGIALGKGVGTAGRRTMPLAGTAYSPWQFWDGRADSHWAQALGPLESAVEHGGTRAQYAKLVREHYSREYARVFGTAPEAGSDVNRVYANIGKAIAAYERHITFTPSRFDRFVAVELAGGTHRPHDDLSSEERAGLRLFIGKANCTDCHNGPRFTDDHFHNIGVPQSRAGVQHDSGRTAGVQLAMKGEFNCLSQYSDAKPEECSELRFAVTEGEELVGAFKTPSLRNVVNRAPFMHGGQFGTMQEVLTHYNNAPKASLGHSELKRLRLSEKELQQLDAFLRTITSPVTFPHAEGH